MPTSDQQPTQAQVDQAIDWLVKLRYDSPGPRTKQQFQLWLASHPQHAEAWQRVSELSDELASLPGELSRRTLEGSERQRMSRRDHLKLLSVLVLGGTFGWAAREPLGLPALLADSRTATGERRELQGSDGSRIRLNTASAIDLRYSAELRQLTLVRGEVSLDSNGSDNRPFRIATPIATLATQGGQLLLRENARGLLLAVRRGEVTLFPASAAAHQVKPGEVVQVLAAGSYQPATLHADPWGWTDGVLSVQQMPLGEFVDELSRYRPGLLRCAPAVAGLKVSGTYQLADTDQILLLIARNLPVRIDYRTRYWVSIDAA
ncbi:FecR domain-containing protein [Pseudomonas sichuanensis]|uniref:FecR domain-containing protein n=1 Tax=Pseudomonas sichuanensis TaxID=2213015 RepID=UPI00244BB675|nr:FecR domain-containing protein [Pseudomonas sichuanensis]MDH0733363.1 FecR domain-containing protein [Pseudomonas sichuanensis]MDH1585412.1 FecR domain-containing protein [Pseudomonas sichuanensis]MDH1595121.1 FecR domain-containing protein [Pseudomonas sichuanensis]MDH1600382.1 FecR domain-containing protein [Pseudomonas sichuanensis]